MKPLALIASTACILLAACSADYPVKAIFIDGKLHFVGAGKDWFFGETGFCPSYFSVRSSSGKTVWRIETDRPPSPCKIFPLSYGVAPEGWKTLVKAQALKTGRLYVIDGEGGDRYHGAFHYRERRLLSVKNDPELADTLPPPPYKWGEPRLSAADALTDALPSD